MNNEQIIQSHKKGVIELVKRHRLPLLVTLDVLVIIITSFLIFCGKDTWPILSFIVSFLSMIVIVCIFYIEQRERSNERELNKEMMRLINFIMDYISIEDTLLLGVRISHINTRIIPIGVKLKYSGTLVTKDNVFAHLNILYAIIDMVKKKTKSKIGQLYKSDEDISNRGYNCLEVEYYCDGLSTASHRTLNIQDASNQGFPKSVSSSTSVVLPLEQMSTMTDGIYFKLNDKYRVKTEIANEYMFWSDGIDKDPIFAAKKTFFEEIEERLGCNLTNNYKLDMKCRNEVGYDMRECEYMEELISEAEKMRIEKNQTEE